MKRLLFACMALLLCGCTPDSPPATSSTEQTVLRVVLWDYDKTSYDRSLIKAFEQENPDIKIEVISYPDMYYESKLSSLLSSGQAVDVIYFRSAAGAQPFYLRGQLLALDEFASSLSTERYRGVSEMKQISDDGLLYAIPYRWDHAALYFNRDMFDRGGIAYPSDNMTWEEFSELGLQLKEICQPGEYPLMLLPDPTQNYWQMIRTPLNFISDPFEPLGDLAALVNRFQALELMPPYAENIRLNTHQRLFETGKYGMYLGGTWYMNYLHTDQQNRRFQMNWGAVNGPVWGKSPENKQIVIISPLSINKRTKYPEESWRFISFISGAQGAQIMARERMVPAYIDEEVSRIFTSLSRSHSISQSVYTWNNAAPAQIRDNVAASIQRAAYEEYLQAVTGNKTPDQAVRDMYAQRLDILQTLS